MMSGTMILNVRVSGVLADFIASNVGDDKAYKNVSEYVWDLIRRDMERTEVQSFGRLKAELTSAFAAPQSDYEVMDAETIIARNTSGAARAVRDR